MKVLFLDIDGVLNYIGCPYKIGSIYFVDDEKIKLLKQIIDATGAEVVLSSTWRFGWSELGSKRDRLDFLKLKEKLEEYGIKLWSRTPIHNYYGSYRGSEIKEWIDNWQGRRIESIVILDDDSDMEPYMKYLVKTSIHTGLTEEDVVKAIKILNGRLGD